MVLTPIHFSILVEVVVVIEKHGDVRRTHTRVRDHVEYVASGLDFGTGVEDHG